MHQTYEEPMRNTDFSSARLLLENITAHQCCSEITFKGNYTYTNTVENQVMGYSNIEKHGFPSNKPRNSLKTGKINKILRNFYTTKKVDCFDFEQAPTHSTLVAPFGGKGETNDLKSKITVQVTTSSDGKGKTHKILTRAAVLKNATVFVLLSGNMEKTKGKTSPLEQITSDSNDIRHHEQANLISWKGQLGSRITDNG
jgi:hypothetical protein